MVTWDNIKIVSSEPADYYCVINRPPKNISIDKSRTILFRMEPNMENDSRQWEDWANPNSEEFLFVGNHIFVHFYLQRVRHPPYN